jgi:hypothetical protein
MKIKPVESITPPNYPDKYSAEHKQALTRALPKRWLKAPLALSLSAAVALGLSGCEAPPFAIMGMTPIPTDERGTDSATSDERMFIPLFEFGNGTGSIGCVSVNAQHFMSEEEAFAILTATFEEAGLELVRNGTMLSNATIPVVDTFDWENMNRGTTQGYLQVNEVAGISVKFVAYSDLRDWQWQPQEGEEVPPRVSANSYDTKSAARTLAENNAELVVFYDPLYRGTLPGFNSENWREEIQNTREEWREKSEQLLQQQANAFVQWLQQEGLI